jgi:hypothetical protein
MFYKKWNCDPHLILVDHIDFLGFSTAIKGIFVNDTYNVPVHLIYSPTQNNSANANTDSPQ